MILRQALSNRVAHALARHEQAVDRHGVTDDGGWLVACSAGVDSTALALLVGDLHRAGRIDGPVVLAHIDHGIHAARQAAATRVRQLAADLGFGFAIRRLGPWPSPPGEAELRDARYRALIEIAESVRVGRILTAHHADDDVETILLRLMRGTGPNGLCGVPERRVLRPGLAVLRPLLGVRRRELEQLVTEAGSVVVEDPTNQDLAYRRNQLRHRELPALRAAVGDHLDMSVLALRQAAIATRDLLWARAQRLLAERGFAPTPWRLELDLRGLDDEAAPFVGEAARITHSRLHPAGASAATTWLERVFELCRSRTGARLHGSSTVLVERTHAGLLFVATERAGRPPSAPLPIELDWPLHAIQESVGLGATAFGTTEWRMAFTLHPTPPLDPSPTVAGRWRALLDASRVLPPMSVRLLHPGERLQPLGYDRPIAARRLLQNRRIPTFDRGRLPILVDGRDRPLWVPGAEIMHHARIRPDTGHALEVEVAPRRRAESFAFDVRR